MPRVYLCGAVDKLEDLGVGWRKAATAAMEKRGIEAVWPRLIRSVRYGYGTLRMAREFWQLQRRNVVYEDLCALISCDGCWHYPLPEEGLGTAAELAVAEWAGIRIMHGSDCENVAEVWMKYFATE